MLMYFINLKCFFFRKNYIPPLLKWFQPKLVISLQYLIAKNIYPPTAVPMLYIFFMWRTMVPWEEIKVPILPWTHLISCVSPWVGSTIYHMFMNHRAGESCYRSLLHLDMFGIWITQSFGEGWQYTMYHIT